MVRKFPIIRETFKEDHNAAAAARNLKRKQISTLSGTLNYVFNTCFTISQSMQTKFSEKQKLLNKFCKLRLVELKNTYFKTKTSFSLKN